MPLHCPSRSALRRTTRLLRPLLTSRSGQARRPFRHKARSPQVRTRSFAAQSPHLRHLALTTRASQPSACSPCLAAPQMRFVYLDSGFRSTLPSHARSPSRSCASLRSLWSACGRTRTSKIAPMLGAQKKRAARARRTSLRFDEETLSLRRSSSLGPVRRDHNEAIAISE